MFRCSQYLPVWLVLLTAVCHAATAPQEARTARYMESARNDPGALFAFLRNMPKGADLHNHLSGAIYAESLIAWAAENNDCVDSQTFVLSGPPCKAASVPAGGAFTDLVLYRNMIDAYSMRNWKVSGQSPHDHFFDTFDKFAVATQGATGKMLAETAARAASQGEVYQELMLTPLGPSFNAMVQATSWSDDFATMRQQLKANGLDQAIAEAREELNGAERQRNDLLHCGTPQADPGCDIPQRYLFQVLRGLPKNIVFAQIVVGFELAGVDPRFVGLTLVMPEDYYVPMHDFPLHMRILQYMHGIHPKVHIALHAGELADGMVTPEDLRFHVRDSIEIGNAQRIGHGVDVMRERDPEQLLREMKEKNILVEICLTSNDVVLGVSGKQHPLHDYMRAGVPVALATDDEGVARSDMTHEYLKGVTEQDLTYAQLKDMARNSLTHAFLPGPSLWRNATTLVPVPECATERPGAKLASARCQKFLDGSEKARLQWKLESNYREFEAREWPVTMRSSWAAAQ